MIRDSRCIANLYFENAATVAATSIIPKTPDQQSAVVSGQVPAAVAGGTTSAGGNPPLKPLPQANEEKSLPAKHWVKVERIVKDDIKEIENLAHELAMLVHSCSENEEVVSKVMSKIFKKHRAWTKKK